MSAHIDELFSVAYDGELAPAERTRFDSHMSSCDACATGYADFSAAIDAVREMAPARMPRPVRLPEAPGRFDGRRSWIDRLLRWQRPLIALSAVAAVALVLVVANAGVTSLHFGAGSQASSSAAGGVACCPGGALAPQCSGTCAPVAANARCTGQKLALDPAIAGQAPPGFNNHNSVIQPGGGVLVLATPARSYAPGAVVLVYARYIDAANGIVELPCAGLLTSTAAASGGNGFSAAVRVPAAAAVDVTASGVPLLQVRIPDSAIPGQTVEVVADAPGVAPGSAPPVTLMIQVG